MTTPTKTGDLLLLDWTSIATANVQESSIITNSGFGMFLYIAIARGSGSAFTAGWPKIRIECSPDTTGNLSWVEVPGGILIPAVGANIANTTVATNPINIADTSFAVASASNISAGDILYIGSSTLSDSEIARVKSVSGTTITVEKAFEKAHAVGQPVRDQSTLWGIPIDTTAGMRYRVMVENHSGQTILVKIVYSLFTGIE